MSLGNMETLKTDAEMLAELEIIKQQREAEKEPYVETNLREKFLEPPFTVLDTKTKSWRDRVNKWKALGIKSELGRVAEGSYGWQDLSNNPRSAESTHKIARVGDTASIFDPALCELMYAWFCPKGGVILDPFAGGSVRGIVAHKLGYKYIGIELRQEQVDSNIAQAKEILPADNQPTWICGDSDAVLDDLIAKNEWIDMVFSCPPYFNLEVYSDNENDLSNMSYGDFLEKYQSIIKKSWKLLDTGGYGIFTVGEVRDDGGYYRDFVGDTKRAFMDVGGRYYNDMVLLNSVGSSSMRTKQFEISKKVVKIHQNVLCFLKPI